MANETLIVLADGLTVYQTIVNTANGQYYTGSVFEAFNASHWSSYARSLTASVLSAGNQASYAATFPTVAAGQYQISLYYQVGGSPSISADGVPKFIADITWDGTQDTIALVPPTNTSIASAVWNALTSVATVSGSFGTYILQQLAFLSGGTIFTVAQNPATTSVLVIYKGLTFTSATISIPNTTVDLTGGSAKIGVIISPNATAGGSIITAQQWSGTITNPGTLSQAVTFVIPSTDTANFALNPGNADAAGSQTLLAYPLGTYSYSWSANYKTAGGVCTAIGNGWINTIVSATTC